MHISECDNYKRIVNLAEFITEHATLGGKLLKHFGGDLDDAKTAFDNYWSEFGSLKDYEQSLTEDTGDEIPSHLANYVDYAAMARDMELPGDTGIKHYLHNRSPPLPTQDELEII